MLLSALDLSLLDLTVFGAGPGVTSRVDLELTSNSDEEATVVIPRGCQLVPAGEGLQTMVCTQETTVTVPPHSTVRVTIPTICGSPYGYHPPPLDGSVTYTVPNDPSPIVPVIDIVHDLSPDLAPNATAIGMPPQMFSDTISQYTTWWLFGNPGFRLPLLESGDSLTCPNCGVVWKQPDSVCPNCGYFHIDLGPGLQLPPADPPPPPFTQGTVVDILGPQLSDRGVPPERIEDIATNFWEGINTTVKTLAAQPQVIAAALDSGALPPQTVSRDGGEPVALPAEPLPPPPPDPVIDPALAERLQIIALVNQRRDRGEEEEPVEIGPEPLIMVHKGKLYDELVADRTTVMTQIEEERSSWLGWTLDQLGINHSIYYSEKVLARINEEITDWHEREKQFGTRVAADMLWDERQKQWAAYKWAIFNCFAIPIVGAFGGLNAGTSAVRIVAQICNNISQTPDEVVDYVFGEGAAQKDGVPWRKVLGVTGAGLSLGAGLHDAYSSLPRPPRTQLRLPMPRTPVAPPPAPAAGPPQPTALRPPFVRKIAPIPPPFISQQYRDEHVALGRQLFDRIKGLNQGNEGTHWTANRGVNCPYVVIAVEEELAGMPLKGVPPFKHSDGLGMIETWYGGKFRPISWRGLKAWLEMHPDSRGIVYCKWQPTPANPKPGAHVFNVVSIKGQYGTHAYIVEGQTPKINPRYVDDAIPNSLLFMPTKK